MRLLDSLGGKRPSGKMSAHACDARENLRAQTNKEWEWQYFHASYLHISPLWVITVTTRLEKVRLVINQGQGGAQVFGETSTKHLPWWPPIKSQPGKKKMLDIFRGCHLLLHILGLQTSSTYVINNKINDDIILTLFAREDHELKEK